MEKSLILACFTHPAYSSALIKDNHYQALCTTHLSNKNNVERCEMVGRWKGTADV